MEAGHDGQVDALACSEKDDLAVAAEGGAGHAVETSDMQASSGGAARSHQGPIKWGLA